MENGKLVCALRKTFKLLFSVADQGYHAMPPLPKGGEGFAKAKPGGISLKSRNYILFLYPPVKNQIDFCQPPLGKGASAARSMPLR